MESVKIQGSRLIATQMTANPSRVVAARCRQHPTRSPDHALLDWDLARGNRPAPAGYSRPPTGHELIAEDRLATVGTVTDTLVRRERHALCDTALALGPDVPTLCGDWTARDLVAHLLVRENSMIGAAGITFSPMAGLTERAMAKASRAPFPDMVKKLYDPGLTPYRLPGRRAAHEPAGVLRPPRGPAPGPAGLGAARAAGGRRGRALEAAPRLRQAGHPQGRPADRRTPLGPARPGGHGPQGRRPGRGHRPAVGAGAVLLRPRPAATA